jgi:hypothetical protein
MLRHSISKRQKPVGTHCDFVESLRIVGVRVLRPALLTGEWPTGWKPLCTSLPSSPFTVSTKDMTREAPLVQARFGCPSRCALRFTPS